MHDRPHRLSSPEGGVRLRQRPCPHLGASNNEAVNPLSQRQDRPARTFPLHGGTATEALPRSRSFVFKDDRGEVPLFGAADLVSIRSNTRRTSSIRRRCSRCRRTHRPSTPSRTPSQALPDPLVADARIEEQIRNSQNEQPRALHEDERATLLALADDLPQVWNHPTASNETRKRILRAVLEEVIVTAQADRLRLMLHWQGGDHTRLEVAKNRTGQNRWKTDIETVQLVRELARILPDHSIAPLLNRLGKRSAKGQSWTQLRVRNFRGVHKISAYRDGERTQRHELILHEAASRLGVHRMTVVRLIRDGLLPASQACVGAPYVIREDDLDRPELQRALADGRAVSPNPQQESLSFQ